MKSANATTRRSNNGADKTRKTGFKPVKTGQEYKESSADNAVKRSMAQIKEEGVKRMTQPKTKPDGWDEEVGDSIREGLNFAKTNERLVEKLGEKAGISGAAYQRHKKKITGGRDVDNNLEAIGEKVKGAKDEAKSPPRPAWNKTKQNAADTSKLAELLNKGIYSGIMPFCASKELKQSDVQEINPGGAIVGVIQWGFPGINLEHPVVIVLTRGIMFYLKFKQVCKLVKEKMQGGDSLKETIGAVKGGIKPEWEQPAT